MESRRNVKREYNIVDGESEVNDVNNGLNINVFVDCENGIPNTRNNIYQKNAREGNEQFLLEEIQNGPGDNKANPTSKTESKRQGVEFRHRLAHTACVCCTRFTLGWLHGLIGPTFPDLRMLIGQGLATSSWIFTAISLGALLGSFIAPFIYSRLPKIPLFMVITCGLGAVAAVVPWCSSFPVMLTANVLHGVCGGMLDTATTTDIVLVWRQDAGPYMQAIHGVVSLGIVVAPFAVEPFLAKKISPTPYLLSPDRFNQGVNLTSSVGLMLNDTVTERPKLMDDARFAETDNSPRYGETKIIYAYMMVTIMSVIAAAMYIVVAAVYGNVYNLAIKNDEKNEDIDTRNRASVMRRTVKHMFVGFTTVAIIFYGMSERGFTAFLMTFLVNYEDWSKSDGSNAVAVFGITFTIGRLFAIFIVRCFTTTKVLVFYLMCLTTGGILFDISILADMDIFIWVSVALVGFGMSAIFASMCSWLSENVTKLTGNVASILFISNYVGQMLFPIFLGYLMDSVTPILFVHAQLAMFVLLSGTFLFVVILYKIKRS